MSDIDDVRAKREQRGADASANLHSLGQLYHACFNTDVGRKVLVDLQRCYDGSTMGQTPRQTEIHSSQRDVVMRITDLMAIASAPPSSLAPATIRNIMNPKEKYGEVR